MQNLIKLFAFLGLLTCTCVYDSPLDSFYAKLEAAVEKDKVLAFKKSSRDSAIYYFGEFEDAFWKVCQDSTEAAKIEAFLEKKGSVARICGQYYYLCYAFHAKLNNSTIDDIEILKMCRAEFLRVDREILMATKAFEKKVYENIQTNNSLWHTGDKVSVIFPVVSTNPQSKTAKYHQNEFDLYDYSQFGDSLQLEGLLIEKGIASTSYVDKVDINNISFKLKILKLNGPRCRFYDSRISENDTFTLDLKAYGRLIPKPARTKNNTN